MNSQESNRAGRRKKRSAEMRREKGRKMMRREKIWGKRAKKEEKEKDQFINAFSPSSEVMMSSVRLSYVVLQHLEWLIIIAGDAYISTWVGGSGGWEVVREEMDYRKKRASRQRWISNEKKNKRKAWKNERRQKEQKLHDIKEQHTTPHHTT